MVRNIGGGHFLTLLFGENKLKLAEQTQFIVLTSLNDNYTFTFRSGIYIH